MGSVQMLYNARNRNSEKEIEIDPKNAVAPLILFDDKRISCFRWAAL